ncbi:MAG: PepSY-associated TM helix domain-containing protein [Bacteroidales bacterium]|nr:PepSY-associated TM helix domain-containing protein [Bacteroidales bacterium]
MKIKKWRKWNRVIHRDLGYFFVGMTIIYSLSGIAINHIKDWNPNYVIKTKNINVDIPSEVTLIKEEQVKKILITIGEDKNYKKHYFPNQEQLKIFVTGGTIMIDIKTGKGIIEKIKKRAVFNQVNFLHYNPGKWWTLFSDVFAGSLILIAVSGLFIIKGKNGITGRGAWLTILGIIVPVIFLIIFYL